jgi:hypothetical protein
MFVIVDIYTMLHTKYVVMFVICQFDVPTYSGFVTLTKVAFFSKQYNDVFQGTEVSVVLVPPQKFVLPFCCYN